MEDSVEVSFPMGMFVHWDMISETSCSVTSGGGIGVVRELKDVSMCTAAPASSSRSIAYMSSGWIRCGMISSSTCVKSSNKRHETI